MAAPKNMDYTFYSKPDYYEKLKKLIADTKAGDRISLATMAFWPDLPEVQEILRHLYAAARRGVKVTFAVDACAFLCYRHVQPGPLFFHKALPPANTLAPIYRERLNALEQLKTSGGTYGIINRPTHRFKNIFAGRSHIKCSVINDTVFIGGCNLNPSTDVDLMAAWNDPAVADFLHAFVVDALEEGAIHTLLHGTDMRRAVDASTELLIDSGTVGQSHILDAALRAIDEAEEYITFVSQYFPNDLTIERLTAAEARGVRVTLIYNPLSNFPMPLRLIHMAVRLQQRLVRPASFFAIQLPKSHNYIHAKVLATDKITLIGSHNYVKAGVNFGTAEIALASTDPDFKEKALDVLRRQLPSSINI